ncbi:MAG: putative transcriptional regulator, TetR family [Microbacteriaceae bacterium]|nr:putative transcriptional regulator, TetR family [Microbacteriaceae bacterium]
MSSQVEPPSPGTRPRNRREITVAAATELFHRRGYRQVSVADIARATNVGPSAIFRHFPTKSELLIAAIHSSLDPAQQRIIAAVENGDGLPVVLRDLADFILDHRSLGVLWQREARSLDDAQQRELLAQVSATSRALAAVILAHRQGLDPADADLLAWCAFGALVSVGFHSLELARDKYVRLLAELAETIVGVDLPTGGASGSAEKRVPANRREHLVAEATELFAERGFATVGVDDIGSAAGIAGPSVYAHFPSKQKLLLAAIERGNDVLRAEAMDALDSNDSAATTLRALVDSYVGLAMRNRYLIRIVLSEVSRLDDEDREFARRQQREYIDTWTRLLVECRGGDPVAARIRVQAVFIVISDAAQTPHLRARPGIDGALRRVATAILGID